MRKIISGLCFVAIAFSIVSCGTKETAQKYQEVSCSAERITIDSKSLLSNEKFCGSFYSPETQCIEKAYEGKFCVKLDKNTPFGLTYVIKQVNEGDKFEATVRRFNNGSKASLIVQGEMTPTKDFYISSNIPEEGLTDKEWQLLKINFTIPSVVAGDDIKVYLLSSDATTPSYLDDLRIKYFLPEEKSEK